MRPGGSFEHHRSPFGRLETRLRGHVVHDAGGAVEQECAADVDSPGCVGEDHAGIAPRYRSAQRTEAECAPGDRGFEAVAVIAPHYRDAGIGKRRYRVELERSRGRSEYARLALAFACDRAIKHGNRLAVQWCD